MAATCVLCSHYLQRIHRTLRGTGSWPWAWPAWKQGVPRQPGGDGSPAQTGTGGGPELGGPELTELQLTLAAGKLSRVTFSHSLVEITATGQVMV